MIALPSLASSRSRALLWALYLVGLAVWGFPLLDLLVTLIPVELGSEQWRFGAAGFGLQTLTTQLVGITLMLFAAFSLEHRGAARLLAVVCALIALAAAGALGFVALDYLQIRRTVPDPLRFRFDVAGGKIMLQGALGALVLAWLAFGVLRATRSEKVRSSERASIDSGLVVGIGAKHSTRGVS